MAQAQVLLARQPIYNEALEVAAYELLFRSTDGQNMASITDGDKATGQVLLNAFGEAGLESVCGQHPAYINFTKNLILDLPPFDPEHYVIEILEDIEIDEALLNAVKEAKDKGIKLALDDFVLDKNSAPLLHFADVIKVDVLDLSKTQIERFAKIFLPRGTVMLAEKVETHEMFQFCKDLGYSLFQGYFLSKPKIIEGQAIPDNKMVVLKLLNEVQDPEIKAKALEETLSQDPQMSYKLLKLVNSGAFQAVNKCTSLQQAIARLGMDHIRRWTTLLALGNLEDKSLGLRHTSLERAMICQMLGEHMKQENISEFYTVGLFSLLDAFFDQPLLDIITRLKLPHQMEEALAHKKGPLGFALQTAINLQENHHEELEVEKLQEYGIDLAELNELYKEALQLTEELMKEI